MTWTYSGDPSTVSRDKVRFLIGDTDSSDQQVTDEEIAWLLTENGSFYGAAAAACETLAAEYARKVNKRVGDLALDASDRHKHYLALATTIRRKGAVAQATPYAGGISISDKQAYEDDTDRVEPAFSRNLHDNPAGPTTQADTLTSQWS